MPFRLAMLTPFGPPAARGNAVTVSRVAEGLAERGLELRLWDLSVASAAAIESEVVAYRPALIHVFHAYRAGPLALRLAQRVEAPLVVTLTGTDANHDLFDPQRAAAVREVLDRAQHVTVFHRSLGARVGTALPDIAGKLSVVPQSVRFPRTEVFELEQRWPLPPRTVLFVFPGGLRAVKNPIFPLGPLGRLLKRIPEIRLLYVGPVLEPAVGEALAREIAPFSWARYLGQVPHGQMASLLSRADVVLNCSISEGGMANSVLEALALGRAVLASDIDGNRSLVVDGVTGLLFLDEGELERRAALLARDPALRERLGRAGAALVAERYSPAREVDGYCHVYDELVRARRRLRDGGVMRGAPGD
jgi:glycosyltransferase involved in cell wall biosynthesis